MRIDPKYFNLFIAGCAVLTLIVIFYGTVKYSQRQITEFEQAIQTVRIDSLSFQSYSSDEPLEISSYSNNPVIIHFWSTWSGKSMAVNDSLSSIQDRHDQLRIIAAVVKDDNELVQKYIQNHDYSFQYVEGTAFFQELLIPGVPSQILINSDGELSSVHVGDDMQTLRVKIDRLLDDEE
ncbi:MAG: TlpA disulfide reductase family protein [Balneolaceae bacterium]